MEIEKLDTIIFLSNAGIFILGVITMIGWFLIGSSSDKNHKIVMRKLDDIIENLNKPA
jgi:hypothetical protein